MTSESIPSESSTVVNPVQLELVFLKVEDIVLFVPQNIFTEHSEIFADMCYLPLGDVQRVEGRVKDNPITLDGYKAFEYNALLKVLYPSPDNLISGGVSLSKEEWVGVLNLSTRWQMKRVRQYAVMSLSAFPLDSVEKVVLSRSYMVAKWPREGLLEIVSESPPRSAEELRSKLGLETAFRLLCLREQGWSQTTSLRLFLGALSCVRCNGPAFTNDRQCYGCGQRISLDDTAAIYVFEGSKSTPYRLSNPANGVGLQIAVNARSIKCKKCLATFINTGDHQSCSSCSVSSVFDTYILLVAQSPKVSESRVSEVFAKEIAEYTLAD